MKRFIRTSILLISACFLTGCLSVDDDTHSSSSSATTTTSSSTSTSGSDSTSSSTDSSSSSSSADTSTSSSSDSTSTTTDTTTTTTSEETHHFSDTFVNTDPAGHYHMCIDPGFETLHDEVVPHTYNHVVTNPTYESQGYTTHTCSVCGYSYVDTYVPALTHNFSPEWSHDETHHWHRCDDAGYEDLKADYEVHDLIENVVEPAFDRDGYSNYECECGYSTEGSVLPSEGWHSLYYVNMIQGEVDWEEYPEGIHTFGMITRKWTDNGYWNYSFQCSDRDDNEGGALLLNYADAENLSPFDIGDFIVVDGWATIQNNAVVFDPSFPFSDVVAYEVDNSIGYEPVSYDFYGDDIGSTFSDAWRLAEHRGQSLISATVTLSNYTDSSNVFKAKLGMRETPGSKKLSIQILGDEIDKIKNLVDSNYGEEVEITGFCWAYIDGSTNEIRLTVTSVSDFAIGDPTRVQSVSLNTSKERLDINETLNLTASVYPDTAVDKSVSWSSSDTSVATVSNSGVVRGVSEGRATITATTNDGHKTATCTILVGDVVDLDDYDVLQVSNMCTESTNYATHTTTPTNGGVKFSSYRWHSATGASLGKLYAHSNRLENVDDGSLQGAFYNVGAMKKVVALQLRYKSNGNVKISWGDSYNYGSSTLLNPSNSMKEEIIMFDGGTTFVKIETQDYDVYLDEINYYQEDSYKSYSTSYDTGAVDYRISITPYEGTPISGVTTVSVPTSYTRVNNTYTVTTTKSYTYYSFSDVQTIYNSNPSSFDAGKYALTDPVDVANYYAIFQEIPVNYGAQNSVTQKTCASKSEVNSMFGSLARCVSQYNRTDGYAKAVPVNTTADGFYYFEFDIALASDYATNNRDVGRIVTFLNGFDNLYSDGCPTSVITYDHYTVFQEYLGAGQWGTPFDTKNNACRRVNRQYGSTITLVEA